MKDKVFTEKYENMINYIKEKGKVSVDELSMRFKTSPCTIRRTLTQMEEEKLVKRFYGGVMFNLPESPEPPVNKRAVLNREEKDLIGKKAADFIEDGETIILLGSTTVNSICPYLKNKTNLKVITNSVTILNELLSYDGIEVVFPGGVLNRKELTVTGYLTALCIKELRANRMFFGVRAIHPDFGLMLDDINELDLYRDFMNAAQERIVLADYSKFGQNGTTVLAPVSQAARIITDDRAPGDMVMEFARQGIDIVISRKEEM